MIGFRWMLRIVVGLLLLFQGCHRMPEEVASVVDEINELSLRLQEGYAGGMITERIIEKMSHVQEDSWRSYLYGKFEETIFSMRLETRDFTKRKRQLNLFYDLSRMCADNASIRGGKAVDRFMLRLRRLERLRQEKVVADGLVGVDDGDTHLGLFVPSSRYAESVGYKVYRACEDFEKDYNLVEMKKLSPEERVLIRKLFRDLMGREIRTEAQIKIDREKKIEEDRKIWKKIHPDGFD